MVKDILQNLESEISNWLKQAGIDTPVVFLERAVDPEFGEYSTNVGMKYAKELSMSPLLLAEDLVTFLADKNPYGVEKIEFVKPGFINFYLTNEAKIEHLETIINAQNKYGQNTLRVGESWVIEHTSPNPNKAMHLGHLRNNLVGMSIVRLLKNAGAEVASDAVYNNRGISIAKNMYGYLAHMKKNPEAPTDVEYWSTHKDEWFTPEEKNQRPDLFVTECYVLGEKDFANTEIEKQVRQLVVDWEAGDTKVRELWALVLQFAYDGINLTLNRVGNHWDKIWYEHEHYQEGKDYVGKGLNEGKFTKLEDGAIISNLEADYGLSDTVLLKKDGTSLYITQDIALTDLKKKTYQADKLVWVVGPDQTLALRQLFAVCEQLGIGKVADFTHVTYGYVGLRDESGAYKKMSSREGTVVLADDVLDKVKATVKARFDEEGKHDESKREELAEKLALAAVKFAFLKSDSTQDVSFDVNQSVDVQGDSGMYVMYTYVRTRSILKKAGAPGNSQPAVEVSLGEEASLVRTLLYFEDVVAKSVDDLSVHHVSQYLLQLCSEFNSWYAKESILDGSSREAYKLTVVEAVSITIRNGLALLGIETIKEM
ncbi:arginine--tRNA ligase [Candidatus Nomurabacteria bacterium]|nr:arginine--tRNA ligase [Candidatus Kaiserbacteria bacterium]MCB9815257.1 arginine--tRNA ligase [Candidatus Nomurabacteria bacterium]